jgi:hypothetical protein
MRVPDHGVTPVGDHPVRATRETAHVAGVQVAVHERPGQGATVASDRAAPPGPGRPRFFAAYHEILPPHPDWREHCALLHLRELLNVLTQDGAA